MLSKLIIAWCLMALCVSIHTLIATLTASLVTNSGRSAWFVGALVLMVYLIFALTLYLLPRSLHRSRHASQLPRQ